MYSIDLVSTTTVSPLSINGGTCIFIPFSNVAGLYEEETVCPFKAASVVSILQLIWFGRSIFIGISL